MKKVFSFVFLFFLTFQIFAEEAVKEVAEKAVVTTGVSGGEFFILVLGIITLLSIIFYAAHLGSKAHFPE